MDGCLHAWSFTTLHSYWMAYTVIHKRLNVQVLLRQIMGKIF